MIVRAEALGRDEVAAVELAAVEGQGPRKAERIAMEETRRGLVYYDFPKPEKGEAAAGAA